MQQKEIRIQDIQKTIFSCAAIQQWTAIGTFDMENNNTVYVLQNDVVWFNIENLFFPAFQLQFGNIGGNDVLFVCSNAIDLVVLKQNSFFVKTFTPSIYCDGVIQIFPVDKLLYLVRTGDQRLVLMQFYVDQEQQIQCKELQNAQMQAAQVCQLSAKHYGFLRFAERAKQAFFTIFQIVDGPQNLKQIARLDVQKDKVTEVLIQGLAQQPDKIVGQFDENNALTYLYYLLDGVLYETSYQYGAAVTAVQLVNSVSQYSFNNLYIYQNTQLLVLVGKELVVLSINQQKQFQEVICVKQLKIEGENALLQSDGILICGTLGVEKVDVDLSHV